MVFYFTGTGNSLYIAKQIESDPISIPQMIHRQKLEFTSESIGIVAPVYGHEMPSMVKEFLKKAVFHTDYFYLILTYGNRHGGAAELAEKYCEECGIKVNYINVIVMVDNWLPSFDMNEQRQIDKKIPEQLAPILADLMSHKNQISEVTEKDRMAHQQFLSFTSQMPEDAWQHLIKVTEKCTGCGICEKVCPSASIQIENGKAVHIPGNCETCLACAHACPQKAIQLNMPEKNPDARYRNEHISLQEIIASNWQRNTEEKKLGFGCMRMPLLDPNDLTSFDYEKIEQLFDRYLEQGFTYFDVAYTYHGYHAEEAVKKALVERYPREQYQLATKLPLRDFKDEQDLETIFQEQLTNCGVEYFDFYLLHNMGHNVYSKCCRYHVFDFVQKMKKEGKIREIGMSFHDTPELLDEVLGQYGDKLDFVQLQINYLDWEQPNIQSRRCLEIANKYRKPVTVMEPCKGGMLSRIPEEAEGLMRKYRPEDTPSSWAMRFAASQKGVFRVLSGMNDMEQLEDNMKTFSDFSPLDAKEYEVIWKTADIINRKIEIPCTGCGYCTHGCPKNIAIPQYFSLYNNIMQMAGNASSHGTYYVNLTLSHGKSSECIGCGQCEKACPQHLEIRSYLRKVEEKFETGNAFPVRK